MKIQISFPLSLVLFLMGSFAVSAEEVSMCPALSNAYWEEMDNALDILSGVATSKITDKGYLCYEAGIGFTKLSSWNSPSASTTAPCDPASLKRTVQYSLLLSLTSQALNETTEAFCILDQSTDATFKQSLRAITKTLTESLTSIRNDK